MFPNPINPDRFVISELHLILKFFYLTTSNSSFLYFNETSKQTQLSLRPGVASGVYLLKVSGKSFKLIVN